MKTFDVRDIIQTIEDRSKLLLRESEVERINVSVPIKKAYSDPDPVSPFPLCVEVLIGVVDKIDGEGYLKLDWMKKKQIYRENKDCVSLLNYVGYQFKYFSEDMLDMRQKLKGTFTYLKPILIFPMCAEVLMEMFEKFELPFTWTGEIS